MMWCVRTVLLSGDVFKSCPQEMGERDVARLRELLESTVGTDDGHVTLNLSYSGEFVVIPMKHVHFIEVYPLADPPSPQT